MMDVEVNPPAWMEDVRMESVDLDGEDNDTLQECMLLYVNAILFTLAHPIILQMLIRKRMRPRVHLLPN